MQTLEDLILYDLEGLSRYFINSKNLRSYENMSSENRALYHKKLLNSEVENYFIDNIKLNTEFNKPIKKRATYKDLGLSLNTIKRMCHHFYKKEYYLTSLIPPKRINFTEELNKAIMNNAPNFEECFFATTGAKYIDEYKKGDCDEKLLTIKLIINEPLPYEFIKLLTDFLSKSIMKSLFHIALNEKVDSDVKDLTYRNLGITEKVIEQLFHLNETKNLDNKKNEKFYLLSDMLDKIYQEKNTNQFVK